MRRRTPQEKKRLSLEKDRRNVYGESPTAARRAIPAAKARVNRAHRRTDTVALGRAAGVPDSRAAEAAEFVVLGRRRKVWRKLPDQALGLLLAGRRGAVEDAGFDPARRRPH